MEKLNPEEHWGLGAFPSEGDLEAVFGVLSDLTREPNTVAVRNTSLAQVRSMADWGRITITPEQEYSYAVLRELPLATEEGLTSPVIRLLTTLSDQRLLVTVLSLTGDLVARGVFMSAHPNIFKPNGVVGHQT